MRALGSLFTAVGYKIGAKLARCGGLCLEVIQCFKKHTAELEKDISLAD